MEWRTKMKIGLIFLIMSIMVVNFEITGSGDYNIKNRNYIDNNVVIDAFSEINTTGDNISPSWIFSTGSDVVSLDISGDGKYIAVGSYNNKLYLLNEDGVELWHKNVPITNNWPYIAKTSVGISENGDFVVAGGTDDKLYVFNKNGNEIWSKKLDNDINSIDLSLEGNWMVVGTQSGELYYFSIYNSNPIWQTNVGSAIQRVAISKNGKFVVVGDSSSHVYLYDNAGNQIWKYTLPYGYYVLTDISENGKKIVATTDDYTDSEGCVIAYFSDDRDGNPGWSNSDGHPLWMHHPSSPRADFWDVHITADGCYIIAGGSVVPTTVYSKNGEILDSYSGDTGQRIGISIDGKKFAFGKNIVRYFLRGSQQPLWSYDPPSEIKSICLSYDGSITVVGCENGDVYGFKESYAIPTITITDINGITKPEKHLFLKEQSSILSINGHAFSSNGAIVKVRVKIDDGDWKDATGTTSWNYEWDISQIDEGKHVIHAICLDNKRRWSKAVSKAVYINCMQLSMVEAEGGGTQQFDKSNFPNICKGIGYLLWKGMWYDAYAHTEVDNAIGGELIAKIKLAGNVKALPLFSSSAGFTVDKEGYYRIKWYNIHTDGYREVTAWDFDEPFVGAFLGDADAKAQYTTYLTVYDQNTGNIAYSEDGEPFVYIVDSTALNSEKNDILSLIGLGLNIGEKAYETIQKYLDSIKIVEEGAKEGLTKATIFLSAIDWGIMVYEGINAQVKEWYSTPQDIYSSSQVIESTVWLEPNHNYIPMLVIDPLYSYSKAPAGLFGTAGTTVSMLTTADRVKVEYIGEDSCNNERKKGEKINGNGGNVIIVDDEGDGDYLTLKEAIYNASPGDIIKVYSGVYVEDNITIDKELNITGIPMEFGYGNDSGNPLLVFPSVYGSNKSAIDIRANNCTINNISISSVIKNSVGISVSANNVSLLHLKISNFYIGLKINNSSKIVCKNNFLENNSYGIILYKSTQNLFLNNSVLFSNGGINMENSTNNTFIGNIISYSSCGSLIASSIDNSFSNNVYFLNIVGMVVINSSANILENNYLLGSIYESVILYNSPNNTVINNTFGYHGGISIIGDTTNLIEDIQGNLLVDSINNSENITIIYYYYNVANLTIPPDAGQVVLINCTNFSINGIDFKNRNIAIQLVFCSNICISNCNFSNNSYGILLSNSTDITVKNCSFSNNTIAGIDIDNSELSNIINNTFFHDGIITNGDYFTFVSQNIYNNRINGKCIYYYANQRDFIIPEDAGQIILANCSNFTIQNINISNVRIGIQLAYSSNNTISENNISNCSIGIVIRYSSNNNSIYHNHFVNNTLHAYDNCSNDWDKGPLIGGNYWDDYPGIDKDNDGIGDIPYNISGGNGSDRFPLGYFTNNAPVANFTYAPLSPHCMEDIKFNDTSYDTDGAISLWLWDFGDGNISYSENPIHCYADNGTYIVNLTVWDNHGIKNSIQKSITVKNNPPVADFVYAPLKPNVSSAIYFFDFSYDIDGHIINWTWDFGDGSVTHVQNPVHFYGTEGTYNVTLTVVDDDGSISNVTMQINITNVLKADFYYSPLNPSTADTIQFVDRSMVVNGYIVNWTWNFGDGNISYEQNPMHQYADDGIYNVSLVITDNDGATANITKQIVVLSIDYILITFSTKNEIFICNISTNFSFIVYASAFNCTHGFIRFVPANWTLMNYGSNATINASNGKSILLCSGNRNGVATLNIEYKGKIDSVTFIINSSLFSFFLCHGWNLITLPLEDDHTASSLYADISYCSIILKWNTSKQNFELFVPGAPNDFEIEDGYGYLLAVIKDEIFSIGGNRIQNVSIPLNIGWNMLGWFKEKETTAKSIYENITACTIVLTWNITQQNFDIYVPGAPFNPVIKQGNGFLIAVTEESIWYGEG